MYREGFKEEGKICTGYMLTSGVSSASGQFILLAGVWDLMEGQQSRSVLGLEAFYPAHMGAVCKKVWFLFWPIRIKDCIILIPNRLWSQLISCSSLGFGADGFFPSQIISWLFENRWTRKRHHPVRLLLSLLLWASVSLWAVTAGAANRELLRITQFK